jgi:hypothetical protein
MAFIGFSLRWRRRDSNPADLRPATLQVADDRKRRRIAAYRVTMRVTLILEQQPLAVLVGSSYHVSRTDLRRGGFGLITGLRVEGAHDRGRR